MQSENENQEYQNEYQNWLFENVNLAQSGANSQASSTTSEILCPITMETINERYTLACGHVFERSAIMQWLGEHDGCPLCRRSVNEFVIESRENIFSSISEMRDHLARDREREIERVIEREAILSVTSELRDRIARDREELELERERERERYATELQERERLRERDRERETSTIERCRQELVLVGDLLSNGQFAYLLQNMNRPDERPYFFHVFNGLHCGFCESVFVPQLKKQILTKLRALVRLIQCLTFECELMRKLLIHAESYKDIIIDCLDAPEDETPENTRN